MDIKITVLEIYVYLRIKLVPQDIKMMVELFNNVFLGIKVATEVLKTMVEEMFVFLVKIFVILVIKMMVEEYMHAFLKHKIVIKVTKITELVILV